MAYHVEVGLSSSPKVELGQTSKPTPSDIIFKARLPYSSQNFYYEPVIQIYEPKGNILIPTTTGIIKNNDCDVLALW